MKLLNAQNVKLLAKSYGKQIHNKDLQISGDFVNQINELVQMVVMANVAKQDNLAGTLRSTNWAEDRIVAAGVTFQEWEAGQ